MSGLGRWELAGLVALALLVVLIPLSQLAPNPALDTAEPAPAAFVGSSACRDCHQTEWQRWSGSDHDLAMDLASEQTVLGDFEDASFERDGLVSRFYRRDGRYYVWTEGPGGEPAEFEVTHVFGHDPLQQYLVPFPGGRLQALSLAWDGRERRWFHLYPDARIPPDDWLHWTRNGQNWNGMCAECHSTNLKKGYDPETDSYATSWSEIDVGCEACHGPGSAHVAWASIQPMARPAVDNAGLEVRSSGIGSRQLVELCAPCHARRAELGDYDHTRPEPLDYMLPSLLREGLYHPDGQILDEVYVYGSFLQSKMHARGVRCSDCHDSHSLELHREDNALCLQCHEQATYDNPQHHFHKPEHEGRPSEAVLCVKCHMVEQPYMVIDWRADHSFRVPRPDLSAELGTPNACTQAGCHTDKPLEWSLEAYDKWYGQARRPHYGTAFAAAREGDPGALPELLRLAESPLQSSIVRATALELLASYPDPRGGAALAAALLAEEPLLRHTAVSRIVVPDPARRAEQLAPLLSDPVKAVRLAALSQLAGTPRELLKPYQQRAFDQALEEYRSAMAYTLDFASSGHNLGNLYTALGQPREAERYYRQALAVDELFYPARLNLAVLLSRGGRNDEAEAELRAVLEHYPDNADAAYSLGLLLVEQGQPEEALVWLARAAAGQPRNARARYNLGLLAQQLGRLDAAESALRDAVALEPSNVDFLFALTDHLARRGRLRDALDVVEQLLAVQPELPLARELERQLEQLISQQRR